VREFNGDSQRTWAFLDTLSQWKGGLQEMSRDGQNFKGRKGLGPPRGFFCQTFEQCSPEQIRRAAGKAFELKREDLTWGHRREMICDQVIEEKRR
jgi:hypothetical protein